jgi:hypothetical protein
MENRGKIGDASHICRFGFAWGFVRDSSNEIMAMTPDKDRFGIKKSRPLKTTGGFRFDMRICHAGPDPASKTHFMQA